MKKESNSRPPEDVKKPPPPPSPPKRFISEDIWLIKKSVSFFVEGKHKPEDFGEYINGVWTPKERD